MTRIVDLLDRDCSRPVEEFIKVDKDDPDTVFAELTEYIVTDRIKAEYERLFLSMVAASKSPNEDVGVWISGFSGSGKSSFAKNLGYVLAKRDVHGASGSSLFLKQVESGRIAESVEFLNRASPYEIFMLDVPTQLSPRAGSESIAEAMYRTLLRDLDYAEDHAISKLEIELEKEGKLQEFEALCHEEYKQEWRAVRNGSRKFERCSALLHRLDPRTYASADSWLNAAKAQPSTGRSVKDLVARSFDRCDVRRHGKAIAFIVDEVDQYVAHDGKRLESLLAVVEEFGRQGVERLRAGKIPGPAWIIVTAQAKLRTVYDRLMASRIGLARLEDHFGRQIDLSATGLREVVTSRVLRKKPSQEPILRELFRERGASLMQNVKLERSSRRTEFDEDEFVQSYPYLPHLIDLSIDILAGMRLQPNAAKYIGSSNRTIVKQCFEMLVSDRTRLAEQLVAALVSIDKIYELVEGNIPWENQKDVVDIRQRFDDDKDYPGMASRVGKAICLMEFAQKDLPRTTSNIAALLVQRVNEAPPTFAVAVILKRLEVAQFVRETENGWTFYDFDELRCTVADLERLNKAVGSVNPRASGWHNDLIQRVKKLIARTLTWYIRPLQEFNVSVSRSLEEIAGALDHLSMKMVALDRFSMNKAALGLRNTFDQATAQSENATVRLAAIEQQLVLLQAQVQSLVSLEKTVNREVSAGGVTTEAEKPGRESSASHLEPHLGSDRTAYVIGLFGTGRQYVNELMRHNIGERAKYFRDGIRVHPGPTPMIYSGHATIRYVSRGQELPAVTGRLLELVRLGFADLIFLYRHPLDSLLTNWVWWRTKLRDDRTILGISEVYKDTNDLCADLERNFSEFQAFAEGDPDFFAGVPGPRFLSFHEFVEETELHRQSATLSLRLEDFMTDPIKAFSRIVEVMSVDVDLARLYLVPPRSMPYGYLAAKEKVPRFRNFISGLDELTKSRIDKLGYSLEP